MVDLRICKDRHEVNSQLAALLIEKVQSNPVAVIGFATGSTPIEAYGLLVEDARKNKTDWSRITTFNLDEFVGLAPTDPQSYRYYMDSKLFSKIKFDDKLTHVPSGLGDMAKEAENYEKLIAAAGGIDLQIASLGGNGHIGFNEPGTAFESRTHVAELAPSTISAHAAKFFDSPADVPRKAITVGIATIMGSKTIVVPAYGEDKADAVRALIELEPTTQWPCSVLKTHMDVIAIVDEAAASKLKKSSSPS